jgi:hypothetical protein
VRKLSSKEIKFSAWSFSVKAGLYCQIGTTAAKLGSYDRNLQHRLDAFNKVLRSPLDSV